MTPQTLGIDRQFRGVGRIKLRTGTMQPQVRRKLDRMLTALADEGRIDLLRAIRDRQLSLMEAHHAYQHKSLDKLPTGASAKVLAKAMKTWIAELSVPDDCSAKHKESLETSRRYLERLSKKALVADLPRLLEKLRAGTLGKKHARSFNLCRSAALAFVRSTLKKSHPLWLAIAAVEHRKISKTSKRKGRPLTVELMRNYFPAPDSDPIDAIAWTMATSSMHQQELWGEWHVLADRIHVEGTKRGGRTRDVPLVLAPVVPRMHRRTFEDKLRVRANGAFQCYDLRRTYTHWLETAGIPRTRRRLYVGHGPKDVTDLYEYHEVEAYLAADAAKVRAFLKLPTSAAAPVLAKIG